MQLRRSSRSRSISPSIDVMAGRRHLKAVNLIAA
jgi:hypothetical protein